MAKHTVTGYITHEQYRHSSKPVIGFSVWKPTPEICPRMVVVAEHSIEVEVPDDFDPRPEMVKSLEEKKRLMRAALAKDLKEIDQQIQSLLAIEHVA